jgi:ketosteroid isomerase-like protein
MFRTIVFALVSLALLAPPASATGSDNEVLRQQVADTERAFARTMADRDFEAFLSFLSPETVFFAGEAPLRGAERVAETWRPYFEAPAAPFSWAPETVVVLDSGTLALSSGPVFDPGGARTATFSSIWRREADGRWLIVFDKGSPHCPPPAAD